jgi:hypothetical protein
MKIIKFSQCTPWCPYSSRYSSDTSLISRTQHSDMSLPACLKYKTIGYVGHYRLTNIGNLNFNTLCFLLEENQ